MQSTHHTFSRKAVLSFLGAILLFAIALGVNGYQGRAIIAEMASTTRGLSFRITDADNKNTELMTRLATLENLYIEQKGKNDQLNEQIGRVNNTVVTLDRLSKVDQQLLQKYSKVYFLNENYMPSKLSFISTEHLSDPNRPIQIHSDVLPHLQSLIEGGKYSGVNLKVLSGYRSFKEQAQIKDGYKVTYGTTAANKFSAEQGYSEHQLGTTVDFTNQNNGASLSKFISTPEYTWLTNNAHRYGFTLSYPQNNQYYQFEPWHWRFVGKDLANKLFSEKKYFYDLEQREINNYLVAIFD